MSVKPGWRGRFFEDFEVGDVYEPVITFRRTVMVYRRGNGPSIPKVAS